MSDAKRVLLIGGSGLLGGPAREAFLAAGHEVTVLTRGGRELPPHPRLRALRADRKDPAALAAALKDAEFDFTADLLAYTAADVAGLFAAPGFRPGRLVMISTGQVYLVTEGKTPPFREEDSEAPVIPEPPAGTRAWYNWEYGLGKRAAEAELLKISGERGVRALALRLPVVQGEADGFTSRRLWAWLQRMRDGGPVLLPGGGADPVRFVYAGDAAAALVRLAAGEGWPAGPALNLAQPAETTLKEFLGLAADAAGFKPKFVPVSAAGLERAGLDESAAPFWGRWCSRPDPSAALALGFKTRMPAEYLPGVVRAHLESPPPPHEGYARRAAELALAARLAASGGAVD